LVSSFSRTKIFVVRDNVRTFKKVNKKRRRKKEEERKKKNKVAEKPSPSPSRTKLPFLSLSIYPFYLLS